MVAVPGVAVPPSLTYRCTRPLPESGVNSASSTPSFRTRHSSASEPPRTTAIFGKSPSLWLRGRRNSWGSSITLSWHAVTLGSVIWRRHLPT
jgi:hypothetical protein